MELKDTLWELMTDHDVHMTNAVGMCDDHKHTHVCSGEHLPTNTSRAERTPLGSCSGKKRMAWQPQPQADTRRKRKRQLIITLLRGTAKKPRAGPGRPKRQDNMIVSLKGNNRCPNQQCGAAPRYTRFGGFLRGRHTLGCCWGYVQRRRRHVHVRSQKAGQLKRNALISARYRRDESAAEHVPNAARCTAIGVRREVVGS